MGNQINSIILFSTSNRVKLMKRVDFIESHFKKSLQLDIKVRPFRTIENKFKWFFSFLWRHLKKACLQSC